MSSKKIEIPYFLNDEIKETINKSTIHIILGEDHRKNIIEKNNIVVIDFYTDWCGPCKQMSPLYEQFSKDFPNITFCKESLETNYAGKPERIKAVPCFYFFYNNQWVKNLTIKGANIDKLRENLTKLNEKFLNDNKKF